MVSLLLQLAGPMQSWGSQSRFNRRSTDDAPTKSGIVGLLAAATGRRRIDPIEDLARIRLAIRIDQPGQLMRDYHTAAARTGRIDRATGRPAEKTQLSERFYLADAVFLAVVEADPSLVGGLAEALRNPVFVLSLGRRSCVPSRPLLLGTSQMPASDVIATHRWLASPREQVRHKHVTVRLETVVDCPPGTPGAEARRDEPVSFDPVRREYGWRSVLRSGVHIANPAVAPDAPVADHDPFELLG
jgi:CRISPR system Cascade subunit CasD